VVLTRARVVALLVSLAAMPAPAAQLTAGAWGGPGIRLSVAPGSVRVETECATGSIRGPVQLDAQGRFEVEGDFSVHAGGPQRADAGPAPAARYTGSVAGGVLTLDIRPADGAPLQFQLRQGVVAKLVRCL
jgi:hypothetical protein